MNRIRLATIVLALTLVGATAAAAAPEPGFTIYETCRHYVAINDGTGERLKIQKISMHDELNREAPYTVCAEEVVFTGLPTKTIVHADPELAGVGHQGYQMERPVVIRLGGTAGGEISGVIVCREPGDTKAAWHSPRPRPRR